MTSPMQSKIVRYKIWSFIAKISTANIAAGHKGHCPLVWQAGAGNVLKWDTHARGWTDKARDNAQMTSSTFQDSLTPLFCHYRIIQESWSNTAISLSFLLRYSLVPPPPPAECRTLYLHAVRAISPYKFVPLRPRAVCFLAANLCFER